MQSDLESLPELKQLLKEQESVYLNALGKKLHKEKSDEVKQLQKDLATTESYVASLSY